MINIKGLNKYYPLGKERFHALKDIDLEVKQGEMLCLTGRSGSGKSTLLHVIGLLDTFESGEYLFDGSTVRELSDSRRAALRNADIGLIMQDFALVSDRSVLFNVMLPLMFGKTSLSQAKKLAAESLEKVGIADQKNKRVNQLSGGQKQRVAIARAIVTKPKLILADEPTGALDQATGEQVMALFRELNDEGRTIVMITHDLKIARHASRIVNILDGVLSEGVSAYD